MASNYLGKKVRLWDKQQTHAFREETEIWDFWCCTNVGIVGRVSTEVQIEQPETLGYANLKEIFREMPAGFRQHLSQLV